MLGRHDRYEVVKEFWGDYVVYRVKPDGSKEPVGAFSRLEDVDSVYPGLSWSYSELSDEGGEDCGNDEFWGSGDSDGDGDEDDGFW